MQLSKNQLTGAFVAWSKNARFACLFILASSYVLLFYQLVATANEQRKPSPQRIATGTIASDDIVWELLQKQGQPERLIAVSNLWGNPQYSRHSSTSLPPHVQGRVGDSIESLLKLQPDMVLLASYNRPEFVRQIKKTGIRVLMQDRFRSVEDIMQNIKQVGQSIDAETQAEMLITSMKQRLQELKKQPLRSKTDRQLRYLNYSPYGTFMGQNTSFDSIVRELDGMNVSAELGMIGWTKLSDEVLITLKPDIIIAATASQDSDALIQAMLKSPWRHLEAVQKQQFIFITEKDLQSVSQHIVNAIEQIHAAALKLDSVTSTKHPAL